MKKGIILFDIQDFLYQGMKDRGAHIHEINEKQRKVLDVLHASLNEERERRLPMQHTVPVVDMFLPTGDGYYMLCAPDLDNILDIAHCIMSMLKSHQIDAYFVVHIGEIYLFTDMTGRENATGFDLGYASRLQEVSRRTDALVCSESICSMWVSNRFFAIEPGVESYIAKDGIEYHWRYATPKGSEEGT